MHPDELRQNLFAAIAANDGGKFRSLSAAHLEEIIQNFPAWRVLPSAIRSDPGEVQSWVSSLLVIAQFFDAAGYPELLQVLTGNEDDNPITRWRDGLQRAERLAGRDIPGSNTILLQILSEMDGTSGSALEELRPKVLGMLGTNFAELGDLAQARRYTELALGACQQIGDEVGIRVYLENLQALWVILLPTIDPEAGRELRRCRDAILLAQKLSDALKYERSNTVLSELLTGTDHLARPRLADYRAKVYGLLGTNHFYLRAFTEATRWTRSAEEACALAGDISGARVYEENVRAIEEARAKTHASPLPR